MKLVFKNSGMSIIEVMIAAAVAGSLMVAVAMIFGNVQRLTAKNEANGSVVSVAQLARLILTNQSLCNDALADGADAHVTFNPAPGAGTPNATIDHIKVYNSQPGGGGVGVTAIKVGQSVTPKVTVDKIEFYEAQPGVGRTGINVGRAPLVTPYAVYTGYVQLTFRATGDASGAPTSQHLAGGAPPPVRIPLSVAVSPTNKIDYCYTSLAFQNLCLGEGGSLDNQGDCQNTILDKFKKVQCPPLVGSPLVPAVCVPPPAQIGVWVVDQFVKNGSSQDGFPQCNCRGIIPH